MIWWTIYFVGAALGGLGGCAFAGSMHDDEAAFSFCGASLIWPIFVGGALIVSPFIGAYYAGKAISEFAGRKHRRAALEQGQ